MTVTRIAQFTAETRTITDLSYSGTPPPLSTTQAKTGTYSYQVSSSISFFGKALSIGLSAIRMGYWFYLAGSGIGNLTPLLSSTRGPLLYLGANVRGSTQTSSCIFLAVDSATGKIYLMRPENTLVFEVLAEAAIPSQFSTVGTWFHVGITHFIDDVDGFFSLYINGTRVLNYVGDTRPTTGLTTTTRNFQDSASGFHGAGRFGTTSTGFSDAYLDDMFIDSIDGELDAPVPSRRFLLSLPTGAGDDAEWTAVPAVANYLNVDDNPNDGDATYNKSLAADLRDTFHVTDITLPADHRIVAVLPSPFVKRLDSEIAHQLSVHAWDGSLYADSANLDLSMSYDVPVFGRLTTQPDGSAWTEADFNSMQFGVRSRGAF